MGVCSFALIDIFVTGLTDDNSVIKYSNDMCNEELQQKTECETKYLDGLQQQIGLHMKFDKDKYKVHIQDELFVEGKRYIHLIDHKLNMRQK